MWKHTHLPCLHKHTKIKSKLYSIFLLPRNNHFCIFSKASFFLNMYVEFYWCYCDKKMHTNLAYKPYIKVSANFVIAPVFFFFKWHLRDQCFWPPSHKNKECETREALFLIFKGLVKLSWGSVGAHSEQSLLFFFLFNIFTGDQCQNLMIPFFIYIKYSCLGYFIIKRS